MQKNYSGKETKADDIFLVNLLLSSWIFLRFMKVLFHLNWIWNRESLHTIENFHMRDLVRRLGGIKSFPGMVKRNMFMCKIISCNEFSSILKFLGAWKTEVKCEGLLITDMNFQATLEVCTTFESTLFKLNWYIVRWDQKWKVVAFITTS